MNFEPQKFFIGLVDFFSIILPGALLTYLVKDSVGPHILGKAAYDSLEGAEGLTVFLFSSYLLGHFIFLLGSWLLDDYIYYPIRKATDEEQISRLAKGEILSPAFFRWLAVWLFKKGSDQVVTHVVRLKKYYLDPGNASSTINAFQWCKARLGLEHPQALAMVQRYEADSKFFRSLFIVLCVLIPYGFIKQPAIAYIGLPMLMLAFWRYIDQRIKSLNQAYWYIITLEAGRDGGYPQTSGTRKDGLTHAGGVVFRCSGGRVEYLLVQAKDDPEKCVLPKGHIEPGEKKRETAVREVREETGVWARVEAKLKSISITIKEKPANIQFYLMEALEEGKSDEKRQLAWLPIDEAIERAAPKETKELLESVKKMEPGIFKYKNDRKQKAGL